MQERKNWRKDHPPNFVAKPQLRPDGTSNLMKWDIKIPARPASAWYPGILSAEMSFDTDYPMKPPSVRFLPIGGKPIFHPNVYLDGKVCLSIINPEGSTHAYGKGGTWKPSINIKQARRLCSHSRSPPPPGHAPGST